MRIAINTLAVQPRLYGGGGYIKHLVAALSEIDRQNDYLVYVSGRSIQHFGALSPRFQLRLAKANRALRLLWEHTVLPSDLAARKVDLVHAPAFVSPLRKVCPQVTTIHDMTFFLLPEKHTFLKRHYFQKMIPGSVRRSEVVIAVSESVKNDVVRLLGTRPEKIRVIHHGIDPRFRPIDQAEGAARLRAKYGLARKVILFVGLIHPRKNLPTLIRAFARLKELHRNYCLVIAGGLGWDYSDVLRSPRDCGIEENVVFPGFVPDEEMPALYHLAEMFVYPSLYEGFGLPILEAMACGVPVITSSVSSMPEVAGGAALLVDAADGDQLAEAILRVASDSGLQADMRLKGLARSRLFSWQKAARETLEAYRAAASG